MSLGYGERLIGRNERALRILLGLATAAATAGIWMSGSAFAAPPAAPPVGGSVAIDDTTPTVGDLLTASPSGWSGTPTINYAYQWRVCDSGGANCIDASGTGNTYTVVAGDIGKTIRVIVYAVNDDGSGSATSAATSVVVGITPSNPVLPSFTGTVKVGQTLTGSNGTWAGTPTPTYSYQWQSCTVAPTGSAGVTCGDTGGWANAATTPGTPSNQINYVVPVAELGHYLRLQVTGTNSAGNLTKASDASSGAGPVVAATGPPVNTTGNLPSISGTAKVGETLTATDGIWTGATPITFAYQWQSCNTAPSAGTCSDSGSWAIAPGTSTSSTYVVPSGALGKYLRVSVSATNSAGGPVTAVSAATSQVTGAPANAGGSSLPSFTGIATAGGTLLGSAGTWTGTSPITYSYQWQSSANGTSGWVSAAGTSNVINYTIPASERGNYLRLRVSATNAAGGPVTADSVASSQVTPVPPNNTVLPSVTGTVAVGATVTGSSGTWTGTAPITYTYQWESSANGTSGWANAAGTSNASSYTIPAGELGRYLRLSVTASNGGFPGVTVVSATKGPVASGNFAATVTKAGTGAGIVTSSPAGINCGTTCTADFLAGTVVTLTAEAALTENGSSTGNVFTGWSGSGCSGTGTCVITMSQARSVTATFTEVDRPTVSLLAKPPKRTRGKSATFRFMSETESATYECSLDGRAFGNCLSPKKYFSLSRGTHVFKVRASASGLVGPTLGYSWRIVKKK